MSLIGIDIGTTGAKTIIFSEDGRILAGSYLEYNSFSRRRDGLSLILKICGKKYLK